MIYDTAGNLTSVTQPLGNMTTYGYDSSGNLTTVTDDMNHVTTFAYNSNGYLTSVTEPTGAVTAFAYDQAGNMIQVTDALNHVTSYTYNGLNRVTSITDPENHITSFEYDTSVNLVSMTDGNGNITSYTYNYDGQFATTTDANNHTTTYVYGGTGCPSCGGGVDKLTALTDAKNHTTTFEYDQAGKLTKQTNPSGSYKTYTHDHAGNLASSTHENGNTATYTNDSLNRLTQITFPGNITKAFGYNALNHLTSAQNTDVSYAITYDANNRLVSITDNLTGRAVAYAYDSLNRRAQMTTPDGRTMNYTYNAGSRLTQIQAAVGTFGFSYDVLGRRTDLSYPNGDAASYSYSTAGNITSINTVNSQQAIINSFLHTFDNVGNKTSTTDNAGLHRYTYDPTYQLTQATHPSPQPAEQYSYDPVGNRTSTTVNSNNQILDDGSYTYSYDLNGNRTSMTEQATSITTTFAYDYENRLTSVTYPGIAAQYKYDPFGRRIEKNVNSTVTRYFYDGPNIITQYEGTGNITSAYIHNLAIDDPLSITLSGSTYYFHKDALGTIIDLTDNIGNTVQTYTYNAFGNIIDTTGTISQPFTYTGREYDSETGLYYYRARYYSPNMKRFTSKDPIGLAGGINPFSYTANNPVNYGDPSGLTVYFCHGVPNTYPHSWVCVDNQCSGLSPVGDLCEGGGAILPEKYNSKDCHEQKGACNQKRFEDCVRRYMTNGQCHPYGGIFGSNDIGALLGYNCTAWAKDVILACQKEACSK